MTMTFLIQLNRVDSFKIVLGDTGNIVQGRAGRAHVRYRVDIQHHFTKKTTMPI